MNALIQFLPMLAILAIFYAMLLIPENRRKKKYQQMLGTLKVNDEIVTRGGIMGKIVNIKEDFVIIESGPDRARFKLSKNGITSVAAKSEITEKKEKDDKIATEKSE